jgi:hypothetical protein
MRRIKQIRNRLHSRKQINPIYLNFLDIYDSQDSCRHLAYLTFIALFKCY